MGDTYCSDPWVIALCARLRAAREAVNVNCSSAARAMGMTPTRLSALETAHTEPKAKDIALIARLTGAPLDELLHGADPANREPIPVPDTEAARRTARGAEGRAKSLEKRREERARTVPANRAQPVPKPAGPVWRPAAWRKDDQEEAS